MSGTYGGRPKGVNLDPLYDVIILVRDGAEALRLAEKSAKRAEGCWVFQTEVESRGSREVSGRIDPIDRKTYDWPLDTEDCTLDVLLPGTVEGQVNHGFWFHTYTWDPKLENVPFFGALEHSEAWEFVALPGDED